MTHGAILQHKERKIVQVTWLSLFLDYRQTSYLSHTLVSNKIVDHSDIVGALPVGAGPTTSSFFT